MSDVIHLDPTGMGHGVSADPQVASEAAQRNAQNPGRLTECGLKLADVESVSVGRLAEVTCKVCLGENED